MKQHTDKLSLRQSTGTSTATATRFGKERLGIFFNLQEKELDSRDYPPSHIFKLDETGLTVPQKKHPNNSRTQSPNLD